MHLSAPSTDNCQTNLFYTTHVQFIMAHMLQSMSAQMYPKLMQGPCDPCTSAAPRLQEKNPVLRVILILDDPDTRDPDQKKSAAPGSIRHRNNMTILVWTQHCQIQISLLCGRLPPAVVTAASRLLIHTQHSAAHTHTWLPNLPFWWFS